MQMGFNRKDQRILLGLLAAVGVCCLFYFIISPQIKAYAKVKEELAQESAKLERARSDVASYKDEIVRYERASEKLRQVEPYFRQEMRDGTNIVVLGLQSAADNVEITGIEPGGIVAKKYTLEIPLKITARGDYQNVRAFCTALGNLPNLSEVRSLKIKALDNQPGVVEAAVALLIFSAKDPEGQAYLEEIRRWSLGRYNLFAPAGAVAPTPELSGHLKLPAPAAPSGHSSNPLPLPEPGQNGDTGESSSEPATADRNPGGLPEVEDFFKK
jgi:type IV pilus assembly protein PilO